MTEVQYISDANGKPIGVIVPIEVWDEIESSDRAARVPELKKLFKRTQSLPQVKTLTDDDIIRELEIHRNEK